MVRLALLGEIYQSNSEYCDAITSSETVGAKLHGREGKSPDHRLRSLNIS